MTAQNIWLEIVNCLRRVVRSNFQQEQATPSERVKLATSAVPLTDPLVQNYAVWRKSVLWIAAIAFTILGLIEIISFQSFSTKYAYMGAEQSQGWAQASSEQRRRTVDDYVKQIEGYVGKSNIEIIDAIFIMMIISHVAGTILVFCAASNWQHVPRSRTLVRVGWLIMFFTPVLLSMMPVSGMVDLSKIPEQARIVLKGTLGLIFGLWFFMHVGPKAISLFAGIVRASLTLKTLLPESATTGWACVLIAPLYALFLIVITSTIIQMQGNIWLVLGLICVLCAPTAYLFRARELLQPHSPDEVTVLVKKIRLTVFIFMMCGLVFFIIFLFVSKYFGFWDAVKFGLGLISSVMALTVVAADFMLALITSGYKQSRTFQGTAYRTLLEAKIEALESVGLTNFMSGRAAPPKPVEGMPALPPMGGQLPPADVQVSLETVSLDDAGTGGGPRTPPPPPPPPGV
jgi:hypothetical protein